MSFVLHPNEVPAALQLASLGTRYMLALVEIGDDEKPINRKEANASEDPRVAAKPAPKADNASPVRVPRKWEELTPAMQAGIRCNEIPFVKFLAESYSPTIKTTADAEQFVREHCGVESRRDIRAGRPLEIWKEMELLYGLWQLAPGVGAA